MQKSHNTIRQIQPNQRKTSTQYNQNQTQTNISNKP